MENPDQVQVETYDHVIDICAGPGLEVARACGLDPDAPDRLEKGTVTP